MPLSKLTCPKCKRDLKPPKPVPEGTRVKCPACKTPFVAGGDDDVVIPSLGLDDDADQSDVAIVETPETPAAPRKQTAADAIDVLDILDDDEPAPKKDKKPDKKAEKKPDKEKSAAENKLDSEDAESAGTYGVAQTEEEDVERAAAEVAAKRGKKGKGKKGKKAEKEEMSYAADMGGPADPRGPAQEQVIVCTNYMLLSAIIGFCGWGFLLCLILIPALFPVQSEDGTKENPREILQLGQQGLAAATQGGDFFDPDKGGTGEKVKPSVFFVAGADLAALSIYGAGIFMAILAPIFIGMIYSGLVAYGAVETQSLASRPWGIAASILTMIPYHVVGLILDLWWIIQLVLGGMLEVEKESIWMIQLVVMGLVLLLQVAVGAWVLVTLMKEDVVTGFEFKPE